MYDEILTHTDYIAFKHFLRMIVKVTFSTTSLVKFLDESLAIAEL